MLSAAAAASYGIAWLCIYRLVVMATAGKLRFLQDVSTLMTIGGK